MILPANPSSLATSLPVGEAVAEGRGAPRGWRSAVAARAPVARCRWRLQGYNVQAACAVHQP